MMLIYTARGTLLHESETNMILVLILRRGRKGDRKKEVREGGKKGRERNRGREEGRKE